MRQRTLAFIAVACLLAAALLGLSNARATQSLLFGQLDLLVDVRHELVNNYVDEPDTQDMTEAAVAGMVESLHDPFTTYLRPSDFTQFDRMTSGEFSGIGAEVTIENRQLRIVTPLEDSPAWRAGVLAGDIVLQIDGQPLTEMFEDLDSREQMIQAAINKLLGDPGTKVTIVVLHESGEQQEIAITRAVIQVQTVRGFRRQADQHYDFMIDDANRIGYVRLTQFTDKTADDLAAALRELLKQNVAGLIIDVRYNPGGLLSSAVAVSDQFLKQGQTIVTVRGRSSPEQAYRATSNTILPDQPIVILANEASASAAEILTGALKENDRALFVGTRTFGKGSVQNVKMLGDQSQPLGALKLTTAYYYGPDNRLIHRKEDSTTWGIDPSPSCYVPMTPQQRQEMAEMRRNVDAVKQHNGDGESTQVTPQWIAEKLKDPQLAAALQALLGKLETNDWPKVGQDDTEALVREGELANLRSRRELIQETLDAIDQRIEELNNKTVATTGDVNLDEKIEQAVDTAEPAAITP
ncbi:MAG: S41 family peptidase [Phycisphaeraceae bacterium]|nr:S41 family peptidase [Phycisphaeraceae bacterium]